MAHTSQCNGFDSSLMHASSTSISSGQQLSRELEVNNIVLSTPGRNEQQSITVTPGMAFYVDFDLTCVTLDRLGHDIYLRFAQNATIVLRRFSEFEGGSQAPVFFLPDGSVVSTIRLLSILESAGMIEPAVGLPAAGADWVRASRAHVFNAGKMARL